MINQFIKAFNLANYYKQYKGGANSEYTENDKFKEFYIDLYRFNPFEISMKIESTNDINPINEKYKIYLTAKSEIININYIIEFKYCKNFNNIFIKNNFNIIDSVNYFDSRFKEFVDVLKMTEDAKQGINMDTKYTIKSDELLELFTNIKDENNVICYEDCDLEDKFMNDIIKYLKELIEYYKLTIQDICIKSIAITYYYFNISFFIIYKIWLLTTIDIPDIKSIRTHTPIKFSNGLIKYIPDMKKDDYIPTIIEYKYSMTKYIIKYAMNIYDTFVNSYNCYINEISLNKIFRCLSNNLLKPLNNGDCWLNTLTLAYYYNIEDKNATKGTLYSIIKDLYNNSNLDKNKNNRQYIMKILLYKTYIDKMRFKVITLSMNYYYKHKEIDKIKTLTFKELLANKSNIKYILFKDVNILENTQIIYTNENNKHSIFKVYNEKENTIELYDLNDLDRHYIINKSRINGTINSSLIFNDNNHNVNKISNLCRKIIENSTELNEGEYLSYINNNYIYFRIYNIMQNINIYYNFNNYKHYNNDNDDDIKYINNFLNITMIYSEEEESDIDEIIKRIKYLYDYYKLKIDEYEDIFKLYELLQQDNFDRSIIKRFNVFKNYRLCRIDMYCIKKEAIFYLPKLIKLLLNNFSDYETYNIKTQFICSNESDNSYFVKYINKGDLPYIKNSLYEQSKYLYSYDYKNGYKMNVRFEFYDEFMISYDKNTYYLFNFGDIIVEIITNEGNKIQHKYPILMDSSYIDINFIERDIISIIGTYLIGFNKWNLNDKIKFVYDMYYINISNGINKKYMYNKKYILNDFCFRQTYSKHDNWNINDYNGYINGFDYVTFIGETFIECKYTTDDFNGGNGENGENKKYKEINMLFIITGIIILIIIIIILILKYINRNRNNNEEI